MELWLDGAYQVFFLVSLIDWGLQRDIFLCATGLDFVQLDRVALLGFLANGLDRFLEIDLELSYFRIFNTLHLKFILATRLVRLGVILVPGIRYLRRGFFRRRYWVLGIFLGTLGFLDQIISIILDIFYHTQLRNDEVIHVVSKASSLDFK